MKSQVLEGDAAKTYQPPPGWECLPPGDAALTRKVKATGPSVTLQEKRGRKIFSKGVWAPAPQIAAARAELEALRGSEQYQKKKQADRRRRDQKQEAYVEDFEAAVLDFLGFHQRHQVLARALAQRVAAHATPIGSGTVARTQRIPLARRAEAAVIAWMRHQTTAYDHMKIERVKGKRREVRAQLAAESRKILESYRRGMPVSAGCPLQLALNPAS